MGVINLSLRAACLAKFSGHCACKSRSYPVVFGGYKLFNIFFQGEGRNHLHDRHPVHLLILYNGNTFQSVVFVVFSKAGITGIQQFSQSSFSAHFLFMSKPSDILNPDNPLLDSEEEDDDFEPGKILLCM